MDIDHYITQYPYGFWEKVLDFSRGDAIRVDDLSIVYGTEKKKDEINSMQSQELNYLKSNAAPCFIIWNTLFIKSDGSVALCNVDQCRRIKLGNLKESGIEEIWRNSQVRRDIAIKHMESGRGSVDICKNCIAWL